MGSALNSRAVTYGALNILSASGIVFANKLVLSTMGFHFTYVLTLVHTLTTVVGMRLFAQFGLFERKQLPYSRLVALSAAYCGYIVLSNLNLQLNTVSFYQITKIAVAPAVLAIEVAFFGTTTTKEKVAAIMLTCVGVGLSTLSDFQLGLTSMGLLVGLGHIVATTFYLIWAGSMQKELKASATQLLEQYSVIAAGMLAVLVPVFEPLGLLDPKEGTLAAYQFTPQAVAAIAVSSVLGLLVSLSTFLFIGASSSITYNVVGHVKTVIVLGGGYLLFGEQMPLKKCAGIATAMLGIVWYSQLQMKQKPVGGGSKAAAPRGDTEEPLLKDSKGNNMQKP